MKQREFQRMHQSRVARGAVGATAVRGRGNAGVVKAARAFLRRVNLEDIQHQPAYEIHGRVEPHH